MRRMLVPILLVALCLVATATMLGMGQLAGASLFLAGIVMLATGIVPTDESVAASTMKPLPVTPAAPFEVRSRMAMMPS